MENLSSHRRRRLWASASPLLFGGGATIIAALTPWLVASLSRSTTGETMAVPHGFLWALAVGATVAIVLLLLQMHSEYRRRTYDPTWAIKFDDLFNSAPMKRTRSRAAKSLRKKPTVVSQERFSDSDVDDMLDFFEDLAFYMRGDQLTPEIVHHAFHYWIRGYYCAAHGYMIFMQKDLPAIWEFVTELFEITFEVEAERSKGKEQKFLTQDGLRAFLEDESKLGGRASST